MLGIGSLMLTSVADARENVCFFQRQNGSVICNISVSTYRDSNGLAMYDAISQCSNGSYGEYFGIQGTFPGCPVDA